MAVDIEVIASRTPSRLPSAGMMTRNSRTSNAPDSPALSTFISTDLGPGAAPSASAGRDAVAPVSRRWSSSVMVVR